MYLELEIRNLITICYYASLMDLIVLKMWYDGSWITSENGKMDYYDGIATVIVVRNDITFDQLIGKVSETIGKNLNEYSLSLKTVLKSTFGSDGREGFPVDITNDEMVQALLILNSQAGNHGLTPFYVTAYPKVAMKSQFTHSTSHVFAPTTQSKTFGIRIETGGPSYSPTWNDDSGYSPWTDEQLCNNEINEGIELPRNQSNSSREYSDIQVTSFDPLKFMPPSMASELTAPDMIAESSSGGIAVGHLFGDKKIMYMELSMFAIAKKFEFKVAKSTKTRFDVHCAVDSCKWRFRATRMNDEMNVPWVVMRCDKLELHTCHNELFHNGHRQAKSRVVGHIIKDKFSDGRRIYSPNDIISDVNNDHNVKITYQQAYRAKEVALELLRGSEEESYKLLNWYSFVLQQNNSGTITQLMKNEDDNFMYFFLALGSTIKGFLQFIRPVIAVDGAHLKGKYRGTLFVATCLDGNNQLFVIAIGIGDTENDASWEWFMHRLFEVIGDVPELVFISDRHKSIEKAIFRVFPTAEHGVCFYHVQGNLKSIFKMEPKAWTKFKLLFIAAAKEYDPIEFEKQMRGLWGMHPEDARYLEEDVGVRNWARS